MILHERERLPALSALSRVVAADRPMPREADDATETGAGCDS